jgi:hypothetical protein
MSHGRIGFGDPLPRFLRDRMVMNKIPDRKRSKTQVLKPLTGSRLITMNCNMRKTNSRSHLFGGGVLEHARLPIPTAGQTLAQSLTELTELFDPRVKKKLRPFQSQKHHPHNFTTNHLHP